MRVSSAFAMVADRGVGVRDGTIVWEARCFPGGVGVIYKKEKTEVRERQRRGKGRDQGKKEVDEKKESIVHDKSKARKGTLLEEGVEGWKRL